MPIPSEALVRALAAVTLSATAKVVLVTVGILAGLDGVYLSARGWSRLSSSTGMSPKKVQRALRELEAAGWTLRVQAGRRPSTVRLLTWTKTVQVSADRRVDKSVHMDTGVRTEPARVDGGCPSEGQIRVGGEGGGAVRSHDLPSVPATPVEPAKSEPISPAHMAPEQNRPEVNPQKSQTGQLFGDEPAPKKPKRRARSGRADPGCTDDQWASVINAWIRARELGGMTAAWGRWKDTDRNRKLAARIWADGHSAEDLMRVMEHIGRGLADETHDPKWTTLEHVARHVDRYLHEAAAGPSRRPRGGMAPITLLPAERDPTAEELANDEQLIRALEGQRQ